MQKIILGITLIITTLTVNATTTREERVKMFDESIRLDIIKLETMRLNRDETLAASIIQNTTKLLSLGQAMENSRHNNPSSCGTQMRTNQKLAKQLRQQADKLPLKYIHLQVATADVRSCVSCSYNALEACDRVKESLREQ